MSATMLAWLMAVLMAAPLAAGLTVVVRPNSEECLLHDARRGERVLGSFQVVSGGFLDIDVKVWNPDQTIVYQQDRQVEGTYSFTAQSDGAYKFCFSNAMSAVTSKSVSFNILVGNALSLHGVAQQDHLTPLENTILILGEGLSSVRNEQKYIKTRERLVRDTNESTKRRVLWWNIIKTTLLVVVGAWQIFYLKRLFENKPIVASFRPTDAQGVAPAGGGSGGGSGEERPGSLVSMAAAQQQQQQQAVDPTVLQLQQQVSQEVFMRQMLDVTNRCFVQCVKKPGYQLDNKERACVLRCVDLYTDARDLVANVVEFGPRR